MADIDDTGDLGWRARILDAALDELADSRNVDDFTLELVAARAGVDPLAVKQFWANTPALFTATLLEWGERNIPIPNTGTLRGDLAEYSRRFAAATNSPTGRMLLELVVISSKEWDSYGSRAVFRKARPDRMSMMVQRAIDRGECDEGVDPAMVVEVLASALCTPLLFYDSPISDEFCAQVVELFLNGTLRRQN